MGYSTFFEFKTDRPVDEDTYKLLYGIFNTRRMKRSVGRQYGVEGEFYVTGNDDDDTIVDKNNPPKTQPSLYCPWEIQKIIKRYLRMEAKPMSMINGLCTSQNFSINADIFLQGRY